MELITYDLWADFKNICVSKNLKMQMQELTTVYRLFSFDGVIEYRHDIIKESPRSTMQADFEDNFKSGVNQKIDINYGNLENGVDTILSLTTTAVEVKVGAQIINNRKLIIMQALSNNVKWGFSQNSQSFDLFRNQSLTIDARSVRIWVRVSSGTGSVAIAEVL